MYTKREYYLVIAFQYALNLMTEIYIYIDDQR